MHCDSVVIVYHENCQVQWDISLLPRLRLNVIVFGKFPCLTAPVALRYQGPPAGFPQGLQLVLGVDGLVELLHVADPELSHHVQQEVCQLRPLTDPVDQLLQLKDYKEVTITTIITTINTLPITEVSLSCRRDEDRSLALYRN